MTQSPLFSHKGSDLVFSISMAGVVRPFFAIRGFEQEGDAFAATVGSLLAWIGD
jgi:hypothetical protein